MKQKFRQLTLVKVTANLPGNMSHFPKDFMGVIKGSYSQLYGGDDVRSYSIYKLENGIIVDNISWYPESTLTEAVTQDREFAEELIEDSNAPDDINVFDVGDYALSKNMVADDFGWTRLEHGGRMNAFTFNQESCNAIHINGKCYSARATANYTDPHFKVNFNVELQA